MPTTVMEAEELYAVLAKGVGVTMPILSKGRPLTKNEMMTLADVETLAFHLSLQLAALEARGWTLLFWRSSDLSVIELRETKQKLYLLTNMEQLVSLDKKDPNQLVLVYPAVYPIPAERCAPELMTMAALPFITHRSASYYSLALLCLELLGPASLGPASLGPALETLRGTKLFYFLDRCLQADPRERLCCYL